MGGLKRWWSLSKSDHYHQKFQLFQLSCKIVLEFETEISDRNLIMTLLIMGICTVVWKALYEFKIKRAQEARHNQIFFQNVQNNEIFEIILKMFKNNSWINVYYTKSKHLQSLDDLLCFPLKYLFWVNLVQKLKIISLSWNFVPRLIQICRIPWRCSLSLF